MPILEKTQKMMLEASSQIRQFERRKLSENINLYQSGKRKKNLIICFCGKANRLLMPIPVFLQHIPDDLYDVVVLMDPSGLCFHNGVPGFESGIQKCLDKLSRRLPLAAYTNVTTFGTSGGGCAAIYSGVYLQANLAISIGGRHPLNYNSTNAEFSKIGLTGDEFDRLLKGMGGNLKTTIKVVYGDLHTEDKISALTFYEHLANVKLVPIAGSAEHSPFVFLMKQSKSNPFFNALLDDSR